MAKKKIRECVAKRLFKRLMKQHLGLDVRVDAVQVTAKTNLHSLGYRKERLVVKPDMLFGKRGAGGMVLVNASYADVVKFLKEKMGSMYETGKVKGPLTHFLIEPFIAHDEKQEYYMSIVTKRRGNIINFSAKGGVTVEDSWDESMVSIAVGVLDNIDDIDVAGQIAQKVDKAQAAVIADFLKACYKVFTTFDYALLEMNPFVCDMAAKECIPLDMRTELDDQAAFQQAANWGDIEFPEAFGTSAKSKEEMFIEELDSKSGASLKLQILNPKGRIWTMVAGGGASVIYADTVVDLGYGGELGNYGEYSGAPNEEETYCYAKTLLDLLSRNPDNRRRALICGGGIANFTDVALTFAGIIRALREYRDRLVAAKVKMFVRRGGPNYLVGLDLMRKLGDEINFPIEVYGPETHMTHVVPLAIAYIEGRDVEMSTS